MNVVQSRVRHFKLTCFYLFFIFVCLYIFGSLYWILSLNHLSDSSFLEIEKCPACFGESFCPTLLDNQIEFTGLSKFRSFDMINSKNVYFARHKTTGTLYVVKKLAQDKDFDEIDRKICHDVELNSDCPIQKAVISLPVIQLGTKLDQFAKHLQGRTPLFVCPSTRLIQRVLDKYRENTMPGEVVNRDKAQIWTTTLVNAEPIILQVQGQHPHRWAPFQIAGLKLASCMADLTPDLQTFPAEEGWPFPQYYGACGRYIVVGYSGRPVTEFFKASWTKRVDIAFQILRIADQLTHNKDDFSLYLTDLNSNNFVVDSSGKVTIVDAEDIVVVDSRAVKSAKPPGWEDLHESSFSDCSGKPFKVCHPFSEKQLCSHVTSDHNYYAVCRFLLSRYAHSVDTGFSEGLLHDIPDAAKDEWDLEYLLNECALPQRQRGRIQVVHKLIEALDNLRQNISKSAG